jgi:hypothetical protein
MENEPGGKGPFGVVNDKAVAANEFGFGASLK